LLTLSRVVPRISLISCWVMDSLFLSAAAAFSILLEEPQQQAREPSRQAEKNHLLLPGDGNAQPRAQELDELHGDLRLACAKLRKSRRSITISSQSVTPIASAPRGWPSSSAI